VEVDFAGIVEQVSAVLQGLADEAPAVHVTSELDPPTADTCPHVMVLGGSATYSQLQIAALNTGAGIDRMQLTVRVACTAFSAESAADASRQRDRLTTRVVDRLRQYPTLNGLVQYLIRTAIDFMPHDAAQAGIFATAVVSLEVGQLT